MATPSEIKHELSNAARMLDKAVVALNFDSAIQINEHLQDLLEDLFAALNAEQP